MIKVENLEKTGADQVTIERSLNEHGKTGYENYAKTGMLGYFRETTVVWQYKVTQTYGNSAILTEFLNKMESDGWHHYLTIGTLGFFKRVIADIAKPAPVPIAVPEAKPVVIPVIPIPDKSIDRTGIPQLVERNGNGHEKRRYRR